MKNAPLPLLLTLLVGCSTLPPTTGTEAPRPWPNLRIEVFTDPHVYDTALGDSGPAWDALEAGAFQVTRESAEVVATRVAAIVAERPDLVLITGDLTKDGERASHEKVAELLRPLADAKIPVLVIPGNHDVLNPAAMGYSGIIPRRVPNITPEEFAQIYQDFGYAGALDRDPASLSYIAEPVPGLRVLALDSCRYDESKARGRPVTAGRIRRESWPWINKVLAQAAQDRIPVIALMHHALVEKFQGQARLFSDYVVADREEVQKRLAARGVQVVFTGHFHTLSAALATHDERPILDIEGGTLSQYPLGFRQITVQDSRLHLKTGYLQEIPSWASRPGEFYSHARDIAVGNTTRRIAGMFRKFGATVTEAESLSQTFGPAYGAITKGDPQRPEDWNWPPRSMGLVGSLALAYLGNLPEAIWSPNAPGDRELDLPLPLTSPER